MRPLSTLGWFMCQAIGTMQLDRDSSPLGLVARAWAADVEPHGYVQSVDRERGTLTVGSARVSGKRAALREQSEIDDAANFTIGEQVALLQCPSCQRFVPKQEIDGSYPYECCNQCYWELPG